MQPFVSVIIPVLNDEKHIGNCLDNILKQDYPDSLYEIIVVDNGSTDNTINIVKKFDNVTLLFEHNHKNSPYSARNRGIEVAKGEVIALVDATCYPTTQWITNGVKVLNGDAKTIVGGDVKFRYDGKVTAGKYYDSLININMKESIEERQVCKTANMFIPRDVFNVIGFFPEAVRSGGDVTWTKKATTNGYKLIFVEDASVTKSARPLLQLLKKQWRVGKNQPRIWREFDGKIRLSRYFSLRKLLPPSPKNIKSIILKKGTPDMNRYIMRLVFIGFLVKIVMFWANIIGFLKLSRNKNK